MEEYYLYEDRENTTKFRRQASKTKTRSSVASLLNSTLLLFQAEYLFYTKATVLDSTNYKTDYVFSTTYYMHFDILL